MNGKEAGPVDFSTGPLLDTAAQRPSALIGIHDQTLSPTAWDVTTRWLREI